MREIIILVIIMNFAVFSLHSQTNTCTGTWTSAAANCQAFTVGDGTAGYIEVCFDVNNIPSGGGTSCSPGGACNPPYGGGGWAPRIAIYDSGGNLIGNFLASTLIGTCITVPVIDGVAQIYGLCLSAGTQISWTTVDACGNDLCGGAPPPCFPPGACTCANPCGPACGWATPPTVGQVTANCTEYEYIPPIGTNVTSSSCYTFVAASASVDFGVIVSSNCGAGNVSAFSWDVYTTGACGAPIQSGTLASLSMSPMVIGQSYTFCYTFTTPGCTHTSHYPYFVGASALSVVLEDYSSTVIDYQVHLDWKVSSELNNSYFFVEKSNDGKHFELLSTIDGRGTAETTKAYQYIDKNPQIGHNYYKLWQVDGDGNTILLRTSTATISEEDTFEPNSAIIYDLSGAVVLNLDVLNGDMITNLNGLNLKNGIYLVQMFDVVGNSKTLKYAVQD